MSKLGFLTAIFTKDRDFYKNLSRLALPLALGYLVTFSVTLTDSIMIGRLGDEATSGVYVGGMVGTMLGMLMTGVEGGAQVSISQRWGKGEVDSIKKIVSIFTLTSFLIGTICAALSFAFPTLFINLFLKNEGGEEEALQYLRVISLSFPPFCLASALRATMRSVESAKVGTVASFISFGFNLIFNYLLIFGKLGFPKLGVFGAGISTVIARLAELVVMLIYITFFDKKLKFHPRMFVSFDRKLSISFFKTSLPVTGGQIIWIINTFFASFLLGKLDTVGVIPALAVANTLNSLSYILMNGLSSAVGIIISKTVGEGKREKIREYSYTVQAIFILLGLITGGALFLLRAPFVSIYNISLEAKAIAMSLIGVLSVTIIGTCYQSACLLGLVKSGGDVSFILKNDALFIFLVVIPLSVTVFNLTKDPALVFLTLKADQILKCAVAAVKINRFKWVKDITK